MDSGLHTDLRKKSVDGAETLWTLLLFRNSQKKRGTVGDRRIFDIIRVKTSIDSSLVDIASLWTSKGPSLRPDAGTGHSGSCLLL